MERERGDIARGVPAEEFHFFAQPVGARPSNPSSRPALGMARVLKARGPHIERVPAIGNLPALRQLVLEFPFAA